MHASSHRLLLYVGMTAATNLPWPVSMIQSRSVAALVPPGRLKLDLSWRSATIFAVVALLTLGVASRFVNVSRLDVGSTDGGVARTADVLTVGVIADTSTGNRAGAHYIRGIRLWLSRVRETNGIPYNTNQHAAVRLVVRDSRGQPRRAGEIARQLVKQGASVIFGPLDPDELTTVADTTDRNAGTLLFSPIPRPSTLPTMPHATFLYRPPVGDLHAALDVVSLLPARSKDTVARRRVVLLTERGEWALRAHSGQLLAQQRAFDARLVKVRSTNADAALKTVPGPLDAVITIAPFRRGLGWFAQSRRTSRTPWILVAPDLATAVEPSRRHRVAVTVPWSPISIGGDRIFPPTDFSATYEAVYGESPSLDAAAGAALGALLNELVIGARSTDPSRLLRAREELEGNSFWGPLSFQNGEQAPFAPYVVLLNRGTPLNIWPPPARVKALRLSIPPAEGG
jgi:Periplasmic binding protein